MSARTLYDKLWDDHVVHTEEDGTSVLYIDRHLVHEVTSPQAFEGLRLAGRKVWRTSSIVATADHNTPTTGWADGYDGIRDPISKLQVDHAGRQHQGLRRGGVLPVPGQAPGHRARHRAGAGRHAAGHDRRLRRQPHQHARRLRCAGARHRHQRGRACDGHADAAGQEGEEHAGQGGRHAAARRHRQGHRAGHHRPHRHGRRHRLHHRVRRLGHPRAQHGRAHDGVQHGHRGRRARRAGGAWTTRRWPT